MTLLFFSGLFQLDKELVQKVSNFPTSEALDNNLNTYYHSELRSNASWFLKLNEVKVVKWILISIRGGNHCLTYITYTLHKNTILWVFLCSKA